MQKNITFYFERRKIMPIEYFREIGGIRATFRIKLLISILLVAVFSAISANALADAASQLEQARSYEQNGQYTQALQAYQGIVTAYPMTGYAAEALFKIGYLNEKYGDANLAVAAYSQVKQHYPDDIDRVSQACLRASLITERQKQYSQAENFYSQILQQCPNTLPVIDALCGTARINEQQNKYEDAESLNQQAAQECQRVIQQYPNNSDFAAPALDTLASLKQLKENYVDANNLYMELLRLYPNSDRASHASLHSKVCQIMILVANGSDEAANAIISQLRRDYSSEAELPAALHYAGGAYYHRGNYEKALQLFEMIIKDYPNCYVAANVCQMAADCYSKEGNYQAAADYYQKAYDNYPTDQMRWHYLFMVGYSYEQQSSSKNKAKITAAYQELIEKYPDCKPASYACHWLAQ
jgi:TolA-binding protein